MSTQRATTKQGTVITNSETGTNVTEIEAGIYRISTPVPIDSIPGGFTFNQFLIVDDEPLLFHTGLRQMFPLVLEAVTHVLGDVKRLRHVGFSHYESDECGSLNDWLRASPQATPVCSAIGAMVSVNDAAERPARGMMDGEELVIGTKRMRWLDAPNVPHNWECGYMFETTTRTLLCGDLFTHAGAQLPALTENEVFSASEIMRKTGMSGMANDAGAREILQKIARTEPTTLALMHGSSYRGNGSSLLLALAETMPVLA
jgi:flavorubredoxin